MPLLNSAPRPAARMAGSLSPAEARVEGVIDGDRFLAAPERAEPEALVEQRPGDLLAEGRFAVAAEARVEGVINCDRFLAAPERAERDSLVEQRLGDCSRTTGSLSPPKRASRAS